MTINLLPIQNPGCALIPPLTLQDNSSASVTVDKLPYQIFYKPKKHPWATCPRSWANGLEHLMEPRRHPIIEDYVALKGSLRRHNLVLSEGGCPGLRPCPSLPLAGIPARCPGNYLLYFIYLFTPGNMISPARSRCVHLHRLSGRGHNTGSFLTSFALGIMPSNIGQLIEHVLTNPGLRSWLSLQFTSQPQLFSSFPFGHQLPPLCPWTSYRITLLTSYVILYHALELWPDGRATLEPGESPPFVS